MELDEVLPLEPVSSAAQEDVPVVPAPTEEEVDDDDHELKRHDVSNFIKHIEDSIFSNIGIDDKRTISIELEKGYNEDYVWYIEAHLIDTSIDNRIDVETRRAFINGEQ